MIKYDDVIKEEIKVINGENWRFLFRYNGYVIVEREVKDMKSKGKKQIEKKHWQRYLHGVNLESCLQYIYTVYDGSCGVLDYDNLKSA